MPTNHVKVRFMFSRKSLMGLIEILKLSKKSIMKYENSILKSNLQKLTF
jgi:hypothetical protein